MSIPNGLQQCAIWSMDGRTWIEVVLPTSDSLHLKMRERAISNGQMKIIPQDKLQKFVNEVLSNS